MQHCTTYLKATPVGTIAIYTGSHQLIATASRVTQQDLDASRGLYRVCIVGGVAHGKITYASSWADLNDKSVEISRLPAN